VKLVEASVVSGVKKAFDAARFMGGAPSHVMCNALNMGRVWSRKPEKPITRFTRFTWRAENEKKVAFGTPEMGF
jgi:hypothetical protein